MSFWDRFRSPQSRASYDRSSGDMLVNEDQLVWLGHDSGGGRYPIGPNGPYSVECLSAVTRLSAIITDPLSSSPWTVAPSTLGLPVAAEPVTPPRWMVDPQLLRPDARYPYPAMPAVVRLPRSVFWASWIRSAVWFGTGYLLFSEDNTGQPLPGTLRTLHPRLVAPKRNALGELVWEITDDEHPELSVRTDREGYLPFSGPPMRIVALRDPHAPIDVSGHASGLFERHKDVFGLADSIGNYTAGVFRSGVPAGYLKVNAKIDNEMAAELKSRWLAAHGGDRRSIAVLNATTDFTPIQFSPHDAALMEGKRANLADIAMAFGFDPAGALGIDMGSSMTYSNVSQQFARLRQDLLAWITSVEQTIGALLPAGRDMRIDFSELTRPDPTQQIAVLNTAVASGLMTPNEGRAQIGLPPLAASKETPDAVTP